VSKPPSVLVAEDAFRQATELADRAMPNETGGILVGVRTPDGAWITSFREIVCAPPQRDRFLIPAGTTHRLIDELRAEDPRLGYIGDWHTHPEDVGPSGLDLATLVHLAKGMFAERRLLGLLRRKDNGWQLDLWSLGRLRRPRHATVVLTGPLAEPTSHVIAARRQETSAGG